MTDRDLEQRLQETLRQIQSHAKLIAEGGEALDPDGISDALVADTAKVHDELFELMSDLPAAARPTAAQPLAETMNDLVQEVLGDVLSSLGFPLQVQACYGEDRTVPAASIDPLRAAIRRALLIGANHSGAGGLLAVITCRKDGGILLEVSAHGDGDSDPDEEPTVDFRCCSVKEFIREHGGRLDVRSESDGRLRLSLYMDGTDPA